MIKMAKKSKEIKVVCEDCGATPPIHHEKSNKNWTVYETKCDKCGGKTKFVF